MANIFGGLLNKAETIIILAFLLSRIPMYRKLVLKNDISVKEKMVMAILFGIFGIIGTYSGIPVHGAMANSRIIGVFVGGWLGGPVVGLFSGIIAGFHRWGTDIGGFTAVACAVATVIEGLIGGFGSRLIRNNVKISWLGALGMGAIAEIVQMLIILLIAKPFNEAFKLVSIIWFPMVFINSIGIAIFIALTQSIFIEQERIGASQAQLALNIANKTLPYLRRGLNMESVEKTAKIIYEMTNLSAVAFTDRSKILTHMGSGQDHHCAGRNIMTALTKEVIMTGEYRIAENQEEIGCDHGGCNLKSALIVPLLVDDTVVGTLKLYEGQKNGITSVNIQLGLGLAQLFSTQIALSELEYQKELLAKSELNALQAQINPHFLFNALNTIVSFIRTKPERARDLMLHLSDCFRHSLQFSCEDIELNHEVKNIDSYLALERARFGDKLNINYIIPEDIHCKIPPLILQPIVENAVKHGIFNKEEGGTIEIKAVGKDHFVELSVEDDGVGIDPEKLRGLLKKDMDKTERVGLINVDRRLKVKYGKEYGLSIKSVLGEGTTVVMRIPKKSMKEEKPCVVS